MCLPLLLLFLLSPPQQVGAVPSGFVDELFTRTVIGLTNRAVFAKARTGDSLLFFGSKRGYVHVMVNPEENDVKHELMHLPVCTNGERGLQNIVPHPDFETNGYLYIYRTELKQGCTLNDEVTGPQNRLSRFTVTYDENTGIPVIDPTSERSLFRGPKLTWKNHNGGGMAFGNDGNIYITLGDGGLHYEGHSQNLGTLNGCVHYRMTELGEVPSDNPFASQGVRCNETGAIPSDASEGVASEGVVCSEIFAAGLRNPYRLTMDPNTPADKVRFLIGDVGGKKWEEINECGTGFEGVNYGWQIREGPCRRDSETACDGPSQYQDPLYWYRHSGFGGAVTGGAFVPNGLWPANFDDTYLFADHPNGMLYHLTLGGTDCRACLPPTTRYQNTSFHAAPRVVDMFFGPAGQNDQALYYLSLSRQELRRIRYTANDNRSPRASFSAVPRVIQAGGQVQFNASNSFDPDGDQITCHWSFGDGSTSANFDAVHGYEEKGEYVVQLTVTDEQGLTDEAIETIKVGEPPVAIILSPASGTTFAVGDLFVLQGSAYNLDDDGNRVYLDDMDLTWEVRQHHAEHWHPYLAQTQGNNVSFDPAPPPEDYLAASNSYLKVIFTAKNSDGLATTVERDILPRESYIDFESQPSGKELIVDGSRVTTPVRVLSWENHQLQVEVNDQPPYVFRQWSSGAGRSNVIRMIEMAENEPIPNDTAIFDLIVPTSSPSEAPTPVPSAVPSSTPSGSPTATPSANPSSVPSIQPSLSPSVTPSLVPPGVPTLIPSVFPSDVPSVPTDSYLSIHPTLFSSPVPSAMPTVTPLLSRQNACSPTAPCNRCEGHCDRDSDCGEGFKCFVRDGSNVVPGCSGTSTAKTRFCVVGTRLADDLIPLIRPGRACSVDDPCTKCEGHCKNDSGCAGDLVCFQKGPGFPGENAVPGCLGVDTSKTDWCTTKKAIEGAMSSALPSSPPTRSYLRSQAPTDATKMPTSVPKSNPTCAPSDFPTFPASVSPSLTPMMMPLLSASKGCSSASPCVRCEGHCGHDSDCATGLKCFVRDGSDLVPGCSGTSTSKTRFCVVGTRNVDDLIPLVRPLKVCTAENPCSKCEGHCQNDSGCASGLVCFMKGHGNPGEDAVPGCLGADTSKTDWCTTQKAIEGARL